MRTIFLLLFMIGCILPAIFGATDEKPLAADDVWNWKAAWLDKGDCGPNALYVLMNLEGKKVSLQEIKRHLPFDSVKGCSLEAMRQAADALGFPVEARFVNPSDLAKVPRPFIFHGITSQERNLGHFVVAVDFDRKKRNFALIDPVRETYGWNPEASVLYNFSGYVLVPQYPAAAKWNNLAGISLILCGLGCLGFIYRYRRKDVCCRPHENRAS